jgi:hypothetical protein
VGGYVFAGVFYVPTGSTTCFDFGGCFCVVASQFQRKINMPPTNIVHFGFGAMAINCP